MTTPPRGGKHGSVRRALHWLASAPRLVIATQHKLRDELPFSVALIIELNWLNPAQRAQLEALVPPRRRSHNVVDFARYYPDRVMRARAPDPPPKINWHWPTARKIALTAAAAVLCVGLYSAGLAPNSFASGIGERRVIQLEDGSTVTLNTSSHVRVSLSQGRRDIELIDGEALFSVAHDATRPFRVHVGHTVIEAVGTQFNIYCSKWGTKVSVVEGTVRIFGEQSSPPIPVRAGEEAQVTTEADSPRSLDVQRHRVGSAELQRRLAWVRGELIFQRVTIAAAVEEFNRYNRRKLQVVDPAIAQLVVGGSFQTVGLDDFIVELQKLFGIRAVPVGNPGSATPVSQLRRGLPGPP